MSKDYYKILGVDKGCSQDDIKKAFRQKAHEFHPDKSGGDEAKFKEINEAYQTLSNPKKREQYDRFGSSYQNNGYGSGFGGFNSSDGVHFDMGGFEDMFSGFGDIFGFGSGAADRRNNRGEDIKVFVEISFKESVFGVDKEISLRKKITCDKCDGSGVQSGYKMNKCSHCGGSGSEIKNQRTIFGNIQVRTTCSKCSGSGSLPEKECSSCDGKGVKNDNYKLVVKIPAGIDNGEVIKLKGQGNAGNRGDAAGDLYLQISVKSDKRFVRDGYNINSKIEIDFIQASLGDKVMVDTVGGQVELRIPEGTQPNTVFRLKEKGVPRLRSKGVGDHFIEVSVKIPTNLSKKQKDILRNF